ncbi:MAG: dephospho-CoA kinase [Eubacterium sp.]|nr:dephospho-CoA kinase [Eubacterium sp.]
MSTRVIGITGGIGAGKSVVLDYIEENFNARIIKTDEVGHLVTEPGTGCNAALREIFPDGVFDAQGRMDRNKFAAAMFQNPELTAKTNAIIHPAVGEYLEAEVEKERRQNVLDYVIIEAALYDGTGFALLCDEVWNVDASPQVRKHRLMDDRGYSEEKVEGIFKSQREYDRLRLTLPVQIDNNGDLESTFNQIKRALAALDGE